MKKAIISVDDDRLILDCLKFQLEKHFSKEFFLEFAESGMEALDIIDELIEDEVELLLIISDYLIPKMDCEKLIRKVKKTLPSINVIMLTGQANSVVINELKNNNLLDQVINKPWNESELINSIKKFI